MKHHTFRDAWNSLMHEYAKALGLYRMVDWLATMPTRWQRARRWVANMVTLK